MTRDALTVIIPWFRRPEVHETLRHNIPILADMHAEIIVVNCGADPRELTLLLDQVVGPITQIDVPAPRFNKSLSLNIGIHCARHDLLLLLDSDVFLTASIAHLAAECRHHNRFATFNAVVEHPARPVPSFCDHHSFLRTLVLESSSTFVWADGTVTKVRRSYSDVRNGSRFGPGLLLVKKQHLLDIGGFRSDFEGWGFEDVDVHVRLQRGLGLDPVYAPDEVLHLTHDDDKRDGAGQAKAASARDNFLLACQSYARNDFLGTYQADIAKWKPSLRRAAWNQP